MGKWTDTAIRWSVALILVMALTAVSGCGLKKTAPAAAVEQAEVVETVVPEPAEAAETVVPEPAEAASEEPSLDEEQVSAIFQEAKNLFQLGQETITVGKDPAEGRKILGQAADLFLQIIENSAQSSHHSEALLDYITTKDYFARQSRDVEGDIPGAIAHYRDIITAIGDNINSQKQFYYLVAAELLWFEQNDPAAAKVLFSDSLEYCQSIEPGNFSCCTDWEMLQLRYSLDAINRETEGDGWEGFTPQTLSLPNRDFENYYLLAAGLLDSAEMEPSIWTKETGYSDEFYDSVTNQKTMLDVLLINCSHGETLAITDPVMGDGIVEKNFQRLLEQFPEHPATMILLVKQSVHTRKMHRPEEADVYFGMAEDLAARLNVTLIADLDAPPVQEFLLRDYPAAPGTETVGTEDQPAADPVAD